MLKQKEKFTTRYQISIYNNIWENLHGKKRTDKVASYRLFLSETVHISGEALETQII